MAALAVDACCLLHSTAEAFSRPDRTDILAVFSSEIVARLQYLK